MTISFLNGTCSMQKISFFFKKKVNEGFEHGSSKCYSQSITPTCLFLCVLHLTEQSHVVDLPELRPSHS